MRLATLRRAAERLQILLSRLDEASGGKGGILWSAARSFNRARGGEAAAGMAYYVLFSLFPLLLVLVAAGGYVLDTDIVRTTAVSTAVQAFPVSQSILEQNLQQVVRARQAIGLVGLGGALWSATAAFAILSRSVNRAWSGAEPRGFVHRRLVALGMIAVLALLLAFWLISSAVFGFVAILRIPMSGGALLHETSAWDLASAAVPWAFAFALFFGLYQFIPNADVPFRASITAALAASIAWQVAAKAFAWYASSGLQQQKLVYGSLGTVVALLLWIYLSSVIVFMGAHLGAAITSYIHRSEGKADTHQTSHDAKEEL